MLVLLRSTCKMEAVSAWNNQQEVQGAATHVADTADRQLLCRYLSHFRSVHRGAYFAELRTTTVRKLLPESWGFLCPVHTPDGSPCGLLNHFTAACRIVAEPCEGADEIRTAVAQVSRVHQETPP